MKKAPYTGSAKTIALLLALRIAMGVTEAEGDEYAAADMDGSGAVTVSDAVMILRAAMGVQPDTVSRKTAR